MAPKLLAAARLTSTAAYFCLSFSSMAYLPVACTSAVTVASASPVLRLLLQRLSEATTSSDVISLPLWNLIPWRSLIV